MKINGLLNFNEADFDGYVFIKFGETECQVSTLEIYKALLPTLEKVRKMCKYPTTPPA